MGNVYGNIAEGKDLLDYQQMAMMSPKEVEARSNSVVVRASSVIRQSGVVSGGQSLVPHQYHRRRQGSVNKQ